tara:strand:+ start:519 stop:3038 length:2520 start_codon:yes stop_codon:yes gene_type:complete
MKNKNILFIFYIFFNLLFLKVAFSDEIYFETPEILTFENGNVIIAPKGGKAITDDNVVILADRFEYNKITTLLEAYDNVVVIDDENNMTLKTNNLFYLKNQNKSYTKGKTEINSGNEYLINSSDVIFYRNKNLIESENFTTLEDTNNNYYTANNFKYLTLKKVFRGKKLSLINEEKDEYFFDEGMVNLVTNEFQGKNLEVNFETQLFPDPDNEKSDQNEPRLRGTTSYSDQINTKVTKGVYTTCKRREDDKCPPWMVKGSQIDHDKNKKRIYYKNAWLKFYNIPIVYYPWFFHPDPTVKRQSGFLRPEVGEKTSVGESAYIPYFHVLSDNRDLTFKPRFYAGDIYTFQTEYRHVTKNSDNIVDASFTSGHKSSPSRENNATRSHFFSRSNINLDYEEYDFSDISIELQKVTNDTYLKVFALESPLISNDDGTIESFINFNLTKENFRFDSEIKAYETLSGKNNDRYQFLLPSYSFSKTLGNKDNVFEDDENENNEPGTLTFSSSGSQRLHSTNTVDRRIINNLNYNSSDQYLKNGIRNTWEGLVRNVNSQGENSTYKETLDTQLVSAFMFTSAYPLLREGLNYNQKLTPKFSLRYSPSNMRNLSGSSTRVDVGNIWTLERASDSDTVESGQALTIGTEYSIGVNEKIASRDFFKVELATNYRDSVNEKMPIASSLGQKTSDLVGKVYFKPFSFLNIDYSFSLDNNFDVLKYNDLTTSLRVNNFVTTFKYIEENGDIGQTHYLQNTSSYTFNSESTLSFGTRRNKKIDLTEYYDLIYQYKNDCMTAAISYSKEFYANQDIKPTESLYFSVTIFPLYAYESKNVLTDTRRNFLKSLNTMDQ